MPTTLEDAPTTMGDMPMTREDVPMTREDVPMAREDAPGEKGFTCQRRGIQRVHSIVLRGNNQ